MNRTIAVTGSASGIGATLAALLTERGDTVIGVDLADADVVADLASPEGRAAAVRAIAERADGRLDGLVTCAGTSIPGPAMVRVNYFGSTELATGLQPLLAASSDGRVVLVGSISGTQPSYAPLVEALLADDEQQALERADEVVVAAGHPSQIYPSTKSALAQWARRTCVAPGWADAGIPVNVVAPGVVLTPMTTALVADPQMKQVMDAAVPMPLHGYAPPAAPAALAAWLVSAENTHVTGQVVYVDGGAEATLRSADHF
ncbi:3-alpha-hydroxysteroid dehydrogenase/carbonyl reductase [Nocardioides dokdonensis FR1436]|uniref:3-alpha-hydroxysteroid dehydrogenase/carbonyl reductase n=1 Tax=Nocardioides dokdonensis FR1436 TaxID=1300347 RepID=A0A1A9GHD4_9ACTN|nr:SDR family oxidoreductase [Nocardioides dokdonensis]ANH37023.1 3-alpha-hydroxysteroid dehydrogenase/carbonyl reductase [Nocardioides dokdonensis FR1436]